MSSKYRVIGPEQRDIVNPQRGWHDMRRTSQKISDALRTPAGSMMPLFSMAVFGFLFPGTSDIFLLLGLLFAWWIRTAQKAYALPAKMPRHANMMDPMELNPAGKVQMSKGTFYMGNDRTTGEEIWLTNRDAGVHMLVLGTTGSGKALRLNEPVLTPEGFKLMRDIQVGDLVINKSGKPTRVLGVFPQGYLQLFRITFADGRFMDVSGDHLWEVHHKHWNGKYKKGTSRAGSALPRVLTTIQIMDQLAVNCGSFSIPLYNPDFNESRTRDLPIPPYLLGALLGDGSIRKKNLSFTCCDASVVERVRQELGPLGMQLRRYEYHRNYCYVIQCTDEENKTRSRGLCRFRRILQDLGILGKLSHEKFIPLMYLNASPQDRLELVRGLMDTDGTAGIAGSTSYSTSSSQLAQDATTLLRSLGAVVQVRPKETSYTYKGVKRSGRTSYRLNIRISNPASLFALDRKADRVRDYQYANSLKLGIKSVIQIDKKEECQCIKVDADDGLFVAGEYVVTHNTEMLLGVCQNALNQGSGFMFVDGKAQDKIAFKVMDLVRARGRDDDFMCLNFMTGARDIIGAQAFKITNTMNPFAYGSSGMVSQIVVGLMSGGGSGNDMWADRAISFVEGVSPPLVYMRDNYGLILDVNEYRKFFELDKIEELVWKGTEKYPGIVQVLDPLKNYLINLPGYDRNKFGKRGGQGDDTKLQHGYITMQLSRAFTSLADTYGHIVRVPLGEVFFPDLVKNRRILVVMLPSLEKTPAETANIGKIIVTALRNIMSEGLGAQIEGDREELENEDGKALLPPYVVILDEYGYYAVKGFAVAFAQARSLGFVCIIGGQDLASFQKESKEEAIAICGNTRLKAFGSIEDPDLTMDFAVKTAGKASVARTSGYEAEVGTAGNSYSDQMNINFEMIDRINPTDVKAQKEGQFHFVIGPFVIRASTYYVNPKRVKKVRLNHFVQVRPPDQLQMDEIEMSSSGLAERIANMDMSSIEAPDVREITAAAEALKAYRDLGPNERAIATLVHVGQQRDAHIQKFRAAVRGQSKSSDSPENYQRLADIDVPNTRQSNKLSNSLLSSDVDDDEFSSTFGSKRKNVNSEDDGLIENPVDIFQEAKRERAEEGFQDGQNFENIGQPASMNVFVPRRKTSGFGAEVFASEDSDRSKRLEDALSEPDDTSPLLDYNATFKGVQTLELAMGATKEQAQIHAKQVAKDIEDATRYPLSIPKEKTDEQVNGMLQDLLNALEE